MIFSAREMCRCHVIIAFVPCTRICRFKFPDCENLFEFNGKRIWFQAQHLLSSKWSFTWANISRSGTVSHRYVCEDASWASNYPKMPSYMLCIYWEKLPNVSRAIRNGKQSETQRTCMGVLLNVSSCASLHLNFVKTFGRKLDNGMAFVPSAKPSNRRN